MEQNANAASVALFSGTQVLLIQRAFTPLAGYWTLPGGRREPGERVTDCARREVYEELGLYIGALVPVMTQTHDAFAIAVFVAAMPQTIPTPSDEISDWKWCEPTDISVLRTTPYLEAIISMARALAPL